ncbi:MAG TPA: AAA family ATPase [Acidimicrobiia bacterium]|nr:AAA family ATPase [Acidimicrobiia bacterium]
MPSSAQSTFEPTVLSAVWRFRWFVAFMTFAFAALGWLYASQTGQWSAEATLNVQDPRTSNLFDQGRAESPERYVEGQIAIIQSRAVAREAVQIASEQEPPIVVTVDDIEDNLTVSASDTSDIVTLGFTAPTQREAIGVVNAVAVAYQDIGRQTANQNSATTVQELDLSINDLRQELLDLEQDLAARQRALLDQLATDPVRQAKQEQLDLLTEELLGLDAPAAGAADGAVTRFSTQLQILSLQVTRLSTELDTQRNNAIALEREDPERLAIVALQAEGQRRLSELQSRRDQLAVDADLVSSGVVFFSPAEVAEPAGAGLFVVLGAMVGMVIGSIVAVFLAGRRRAFTTRTEPELVLGARLLSDIPNFKEERVRSILPVVDAPASASAEAFRFVSASISLQQMWPSRDDGSPNYVSVVAVSSGLAEGKTVVTANTAFAAAREGRKVLVMDADFGNQQMTSILLGDVNPPLGMTDVVTGATSLANGVVEIPHEGSGLIHLLARGRAPVTAPDFFASAPTKALFDALKKQYDLILIDAPPLLRVAYATTLARLADRVMIVVAHGSDIHIAEELRDQVELVGTPSIGYVYNLAPLRAEMTLSAGSMADTLGEYPATVLSVDLQETTPTVREKR